MVGYGIVVLSGPPCSGKSTVAAALAKVHSAVEVRRTYVQVDGMFDLLFPGSDRNRQDRLRAYDAAHAVARTFVDRGDLVILECTYARRDQRASLADALAESTPLWVVEFFVPADEAVRRFRRRTQETDLDDDLVRERVENFPFCDDALRVGSSHGTPDEQVRIIDEWLRSDPPHIDRASWCRTGRD